MLNRLLRTPLHEHAEASQRVLGVQALAPDSGQVARLLSADPAPEVRAAAARHCSDIGALTSAWHAEADPEVRTALAASLGKALAETEDASVAQTQLAAENCTDALRAAIARQTHDEARQRVAIEGIRDESVLVDLALTGEHASTRMAAAERVQSVEALRRLADAAQDKDRGVARHARRRADAIGKREGQAVQADAILAQAEALVEQPGPIVTAAIEIERRWKALDLADDAERRARWDATTRTLQVRFDREHEQQRARVQFERRLGEWNASVHGAPATELLPALREELATLRAQAQEHDDVTSLAQLEQGEERLGKWDQTLQELAGAEALVVEAEQLAAGTPIDDAQLPQRWQALDLAVRTPALTRRFEAALLVIEQRRLAYVRAAKEHEGASKHQLHALLHTAEQALAAGQLQEARTAADAARALRTAAGLLPKPTVQRLGRLMQQLGELERWHSFGQHSARVQLCERAEKLAGATLDAAQLAAEVQKLRAEWKTLDKEHANVPKPLWERFDAACEKAYAPAAQHFAQQAALRKQARKQREEYVAHAAAHAQSLLTEPRDLRAIAHWLRDTDQAWHGSELGSVEPGAWKKLDAQLRAALAPLRDTLSGARNTAKAGREALVAQAAELAEKGFDRDAPAKVKALQAQWKEQATATPLAPRDERVLWEKFRAACDAVFSARDNQRKAVENRKHEHRRAFEAVCEQAEQLARQGDKDEAEVRRGLRELQAQWKNAGTGPDAAPAALETRFRSARSAVEAMLTARTRAREAEVWRMLLAKERLCEELDALVLREPTGNEKDAAAAVQERWAALPPLAAAWEKKMVARHDAALQALAGDEDARLDHVDRIEAEFENRREALLELELMFGIETPPDLQPQRLALQVKHLRSRFKSTAPDTGGAAEEHLLAWCVLPGVADARDHQRCERIVATLERRR